MCLRRTVDGPKLGGEHIATRLILLDRHRAVSSLGIEPHQHAVGGFPQGIERKQPPRRGDGPLGVFRCLVVEESGQRFAGTLV
jgi:hypothetical protein